MMPKRAFTFWIPTSQNTGSSNPFLRFPFSTTPVYRPGSSIPATILPITLDEANGKFDPPLTDSQRLSLIERAVASNHKESKSMQKWLLGVMLGTFGAKYWLDQLVETGIKN